MTSSDQPQHPFATRRRILLTCDVTMAVAAAAAIAALCMEYGFTHPPVARKYLHIVEACVLATFVLDRVLRLVLSTERRGYLRENWIDFALIVGAIAAAAVVEYFKVLSAAAVYVVITQVYILAALALRTAGFHVKVAGSGIHPIWILIGSFVVVILFGTGLLMLPKAVPQDLDKGPISFTDALFTATSATCVTGLIVRDTGEDFTAFGQTVILTMIQLGGLGIMIFGTVFALLAGRQLSIRESLLAGQVLSHGTIGRIGRMVGFAIVTAFIMEVIGAAVMWPMWRQLSPEGSWTTGVYRSVFHAVSAFCNAGFSLQSDSLQSMRGHWQVLGVMAPLIVLGGLGFPVLYDLARAARTAAGRLLGKGGSTLPVFTLHSKLILTTSLVLLVLGAVVLLWVEHSTDTRQAYGAPQHVGEAPKTAPPRGTAITNLTAPSETGAAIFQSVTARTAGFNTVKMNDLSMGGKLWMCLLMIVGGSPASTAGGMKTATLAVLVLTVWSMLRRRERVEGFRRSIAAAFVRKALTLAALYAALLVLVTLLLCVATSGTRLPTTGTEPTFIQVFFEACSACGTVGLTCGVTESLTAFGRYVIIGAMFVGRLGPLTLLLALTLRVKPTRYTYPREEVVLG